MVELYQSMQERVAREVVQQLRKHGYMRVSCVIATSRTARWTIRCGVFLPQGYSTWNSHIEKLVCSILSSNYPLGTNCVALLFYESCIKEK